MKTWVLLSAFFLFSCNSPGDDEPPVFFSVKSYMEEQAQLLSRQKAKIKKTVVSKGAEETKVIEQPEWDKELQAFMECDLNRPGWSASYKTDSLHRDNLLTIQYTALEPRLKVRRLEITLKGQTVLEMKAECSLGNTWFTARQHLHYKTGEGYSIEGFQKVVLADSTAYRITASIIQP